MGFLGFKPIFLIAPSNGICPIFGVRVKKCLRLPLGNVVKSNPFQITLELGYLANSLFVLHRTVDQILGSCVILLSPNGLVS